MSEMIDRLETAIGEATDWAMPPHMNIAAARAAIEAMRPEFERISESYSPQGDDTVWVDDRTPIGQYVDSIINRVDA